MDFLSSEMSSERVVRYFSLVTLLNVVLGILFTLPAFHPGLAIPIKLTMFPGVWMLVAFVVFVTVGILGSLGWTLGYHLLSTRYKRESYPSWSVATQLLVGEISVVGLSVILFVGAYLAATASYTGQPPVEAGFYAEWVVIPTGLLGILTLLANLLGVYNAMTTILGVEIPAVISNKATGGGLALLLLGLAFYYGVDQLRFVFFRLPVMPWLIFSLGISGLGVALFLAGLYMHFKSEG